MAAGRQALVEVKDRRGRRLDARDLRKVKFRQFISHPHVLTATSLPPPSL